MKTSSCLPYESTFNPDLCVNGSIKISGAIALAVVSLGVLAPSTLGQTPHPPSQPAIAPLIAATYSSDADHDLIDDSLAARARHALIAPAGAQFQQMVDVELIFKEQINQIQIDAFLSLGGEITYIYKAVSYGWNGRMPLNKILAVPSAMGATLVLLEEPKGGRSQLDEATQAARIRVIWTPGFAGNPLGFSGNSNTTIAFVDSGVDETHVDLNGRRVFWHDYTSTGYPDPIDVFGHGSHVAGIALGSGAAAGVSGPLFYTQDGNLAGRATNVFFPSPIHMPSNTATFTITASWLGGGSTFLSRANKANGDTNRSGWSFAASANGFSPLILTSPAAVFNPTRVFTPALRGPGTNNNVSNFVANCAISNYPAIDAFNRLRGVAPGCNWAAAKALNDTGSYVSTDFSAALDDLVANRVAYKIKVINLSLGGTLSGSLRQKINTAVNNGIVIAAAAGNRGTDFGFGVSTNIITEPARAAMALTVAAVNDINQLTEYSREGFISPDLTPGQEEDYKPDIMAPGGSDYYSFILAVDSNNGDGPYFPDQRTNDYRNLIGTSMATPFVSGSAALVIEAMERNGIQWDFNSGQHSCFVKMLLCATATESNKEREIGANNPTLQRAASITNGSEILPPGKDLYEGFGMINPDAAVEAVSLTCTNGTTESATFGDAPRDRRAWARTVNLIGGQLFAAELTVPPNGDFDLYLYSSQPSSTGTPVILASSAQSSYGGVETLSYAPETNRSAVLVVKRVFGFGTFNFTGTEIPAPLLVVGPPDPVNFVFSFSSISGRTYEVQYKDFVDDPNWQLLQTVSGDGTTKVIIDPLSPTQRFYRLAMR